VIPPTTATATAADPTNPVLIGIVYGAGWHTAGGTVKGDLPMYASIDTIACIGFCISFYGSSDINTLIMTRATATTGDDE
jgi:ABC-type Mn2+/Zn2+ transport system permease subunit